MIHRISPTPGDGKSKTVINGRLGWRELNMGSQSEFDQLIKYLVDNEQLDLAAKLQNMHVPGILDGSMSSLDEAERLILRNYLDNHAVYDALRLDDELLFAHRAEPKLLTGQDIATPNRVEDVLEKELYDQAIAFSTRNELAAYQHELMVTHRMPNTKSINIAANKVATWAGLNRGNKVSRMFTKWRAGVTGPLPISVKYGNPGAGGASMRQFLKLLGASTPELDEWMGAWWRANTIELRRKAFLDAVDQLAKNTDNPHLAAGMIEFNKRHGEQIYSQTVDGREIGLAIDPVTGTTTIRPYQKWMMQDEVPLPNAHAIQQQQRRYRFGSKHPRLIAGFGGTKQRRKDLVTAIKTHYRQTIGPKALEGIDEDDLLAMAYSDVLGFAGRDNGLGLVNQIFRGAAKGYNMFHTTFVIAQLALRPFAWATRVNLEEHTRGWFVGLPTLFQNPSLYFSSQFDAWFINTPPRWYNLQAKAMTRSVDQLFALPADDAAKLADEILPGFSARTAEAGITNPDAIRSAYSAELGRALFGDSKGHTLGARGNMARRTLYRANKLPNGTLRHPRRL
jgi:hypothetical protein